MKTAAQQFAEFLSKYTPAIASQAKRSLTKMRALVPGAVELVYDNYNALVIGFGPTDRASDAPLSLALYPRWVTLFFLDGKRLEDPHHLLEGSGRQVRSIRLKDASDLDRPEVRALIAAAIANTDFGTRRKMLIKSVSKKQRPRS
ncbi:MAG: DUF1801 domain-containing protein [Thermoanaerobaculia bacterium]